MARVEREAAEEASQNDEASLAQKLSDLKEQRKLNDEKVNGLCFTKLIFRSLRLEDGLKIEAGFK